jgi:hypothetical protein
VGLFSLSRQITDKNARKECSIRGFSILSLISHLIIEQHVTETEYLKALLTKPRIGDNERKIFTYLLLTNFHRQISVRYNPLFLLCDPRKFTFCAYLCRFLFLFFLSLSFLYACIGVVLQVHTVCRMLMPIRNLGLHSVFRVRAVSCVNLNMQTQAGRDLDSL